MSDKNYGTYNPKQPGGPSPQPRPSRTQASAPCRLGPAKSGGNKPLNANPYGSKR